MFRSIYTRNAVIEEFYAYKSTFAVILFLSKAFSMGFLRKLSTSLSASFGSKFRQIEMGNETNEGARSIQRFALKLIDSPFVEQKIEAMVQIGHIAYVGGKETTTVALKWLPYFMDILRNPKYSTNGNIQVPQLQCCCCTQ